MSSYFHLLANARHLDSDTVALSMRSGLREERVTYNELWRSINGIAGHFRQTLGITAGARVVLRAANSPSAAVAQLALMRAGLVSVPVDLNAPRQLIEEIGRQTEADAIVHGDADNPVPAIVGVPLSSLCQIADHGGDIPLPAGEETAEIVFTSGTTGKPKGVILTHGNIAANVRSIQHIVPKDEDLRLLSVLPLSHMFEQTVGLATPLLLGGSVHYASGRSSPAIRRALVRYRITCMVVVPQILELMLRGIEREARDAHTWLGWDRAQALAEHLPHTLRRMLFRRVIAALGGHLSFFMTGGANLSPDVSLGWERMGIRVMEGYGTTECSPVITSHTIRDRSAGTVGYPLPGVEVRLSSAGEVQVRGDNVTPGYWRDELKTTEAFSEDGWFRTGDLADHDSQGRLRLKGRLKDMIVLANGHNVFPQDIECELIAESAILEGAVIGMPDASGNLHVHAVIRSERDQDDISAAVHNANARLLPYQKISGYTVWTQGEFPKTALMKVKRHQVRQALLADGLASAKDAKARCDTAPDRLRGLVAEICHVPPGAIEQKSDLQLDLGLDSLAAVELTAVLEQELGVSINETQLQELTEYRELAGLVAENKQPPEEVQFENWPLSPLAVMFRSVLQRLVLIPVHSLVCAPFEVRDWKRLQGIRAPCLLVANHSSHVDTLSLIRALPTELRRNTAIAAAADYFYSHRFTSAIYSLTLNSFPFSRAGNVRASLEHCGDLADDGWAVLIYPEGTRSTTGRRLSFKCGIGLLATGLQVPVIPLAVWGGASILPKGRRVPRRGPTTIQVGRALHFAPDGSPAEVTASIEAAVDELLPLEFRGVHAIRKKGEAP